MVKREVKIVAHLLLGAIALEMIIRGRVPHIDTDLQVGEAPPTAGAGPFLEIEERDTVLVDKSQALPIFL